MSELFVVLLLVMGAVGTGLGFTNESAHGVLGGLLGLGAATLYTFRGGFGARSDVRPHAEPLPSVTVTAQSTIDIPQATRANQGDQITVESQVIVDIVRDYWRIAQACKRLPDSQPSSMVTIMSLLERFEETLSLASIQIHDPVGNPYIPGLKLEIVSVQSAGNASTILETVQPGVRIDGFLHAQPQVVLG